MTEYTRSFYWADCCRSAPHKVFHMRAIKWTVCRDHVQLLHRALWYSFLDNQT